MTKIEKNVKFNFIVGLKYQIGLRIKLVTNQADWEFSQGQVKAVRELVLEGLGQSNTSAENCSDSRRHGSSSTIDSIGLLSAAPLVCCVEGVGVRLVVCPSLTVSQRACIEPLPSQRLCSQRKPNLRGFFPNLDYKQTFSKAFKADHHNNKQHCFEQQFGLDAAQFAQECGFNSNVRKHTPFLAICFQGIGKVHDPTVLLAFSRQELVTQVCKVLGNDCVPYTNPEVKEAGQEAEAAAAAANHPFWVDVFGVQCEVFFVPGQFFIGPKGGWEESVGSRMPWRWHSNSFSLLFTAPFAHPIRREQEVVQQSQEPSSTIHQPASVEKIEELLDDKGFFLHPSVYRHVLHSGGWNVCDSGKLVMQAENRHVQEIAAVDVVITNYSFF